MLDRSRQTFSNSARPACPLGRGKLSMQFHEKPNSCVARHNAGEFEVTALNSDHHKVAVPMCSRGLVNKELSGNSFHTFLRALRQPQTTYKSSTSKAVTQALRGIKVYTIKGLWGELRAPDSLRLSLTRNSAGLPTALAPGCGFPLSSVAPALLLPPPDPILCPDVSGQVTASMRDGVKRRAGAGFSSNLPSAGKGVIEASSHISSRRPHSSEVSRARHIARASLSQGGSAKLGKERVFGQLKKRLRLSFQVFNRFFVAAFRHVLSPVVARAYSYALSGGASA